MKPIPEYGLRREDHVLHRALDRVAHDESPAAVPTEIPSWKGGHSGATPVPVTLPHYSPTTVVAPLADHRTAAGTRVADPTPGDARSRAVPADPATPPAVRTAVPADATPAATRTVAGVADPRPAAVSTVREVSDPTPAPARSSSAPAVPADAVSPPLGRTAVSDPTPPAVPRSLFFDLSKVVHLDGPVTFRSPSWN